MLVIRRRVGESFWIGDQVEIEILQISPSQIKVGIRAPKEVIVLRSEVKLTQEANREAACQPSTESLRKILNSLSNTPIQDR
jgi:carbon storage regulator